MSGLHGAVHLVAGAALLFHDAEFDRALEVVQREAFDVAHPVPPTLPSAPSVHHRRCHGIGDHPQQAAIVMRSGSGGQDHALHLRVRVSPGHRAGRA